MRIAVDLDGVVYEWQRTFRYMMNTYRGTNLPPIDEWWDSWDACNKVTSRADRDWLWTEGVDLGLFRYGHVVTGAIVGLRELASHGHQLVVATHRPERAVPDTLEWLAYLRLPWSAIHILSNGESKTQVAADALVDDKPENVVDWAFTGRLALLYDRPWNRRVGAYHPNIARCWDWPSVVNAVEMRRELV